tara:strand:- start:493 stop:780 length:288 start_codon:yes stop_codon:yes gene_type:complete
LDKNTYKELFKIVNQILWEDWDPIGINDNPQIREEYSGYAPQIIKLLIDNKDSKQISKLLAQISNIDLGLGPIPNEAYLDIAQKIKSKTQTITNK